MSKRHLFPPLLLCLLSVIASCTLLLKYDTQFSSQAITQHLQQHLLMSLDDDYFSDANGRVNDKRAITYIGKQINERLNNILSGNFFSTIESCDAMIVSIDQVRIQTKTELTERLHFNLPRHHIKRPVVLAYQCSMNWTPIIVLIVLIPVVFLVIFFNSPAPLDKYQRKWLNYLLDRNYSQSHALQLIRSQDSAILDLTPQQWLCFNSLHDSSIHNFDSAIQAAGNPEIRDYDERQFNWFMKGLDSEIGNLKIAHQMAQTPDSLIIDLANSQLTAHGVTLKMAKTPLFYYAWYANKRINGPGWMTNPQSNKPDIEQGKELAELMWQFKGHAKAISDLEESGLKAKTLDQNRSKIKDELVAQLGEEIAENYLFDTEKDTETGRMRYRIKLTADQISFSE